MENIVIVGSGCAGLTAAIYASRANLKPLVFEGEIEIGGQLTLTTEVENFPGFESGVLGPELIDKMKKQSIKFGTRFISKFVDKIEMKNEDTNSHSFILTYKEEGKEKKVETKSIIIASGASAKWLDALGEDKLKGRGITTCATCDGFFYKGKDIIVVGGGDSACEESLFLSKLGINKIYLVHRKDTLRASKIMQDRVFKDKKIELVWNSEIIEFLGKDKLDSVKIKDLVKNSTKDMKIDGVFLAIGHTPNTKFLGDLVEVDSHGFIKTDRFTHTSTEGIFACGDVQDPRFKQAITAAGTGCMSAMEAEKYLAEHE